MYNLEYEIFNVEDSTVHIFSCEKYHDLNRNIKGNTLQKILKDNEETDIAYVTKEIIKRKDKEREENKLKNKSTSTAPLQKRLSLPDGRE